MILLNYQLFKKLSNKEKEEYIKNLENEVKSSEEVLEDELEYQKFILNFENQDSYNNFNILLGLFGTIFTLYQLNIYVLYIFIIILFLLGFIVYIIVNKINNYIELKRLKNHFKNTHNRYKYKLELLQKIETIFQVEKLLLKKELTEKEKYLLNETLENNLAVYEFLLDNKK